MAHTFRLVSGFNKQAYALPQTAAAVPAVQAVPWMVALPPLLELELELEDDPTVITMVPLVGVRVVIPCPTAMVTVFVIVLAMMEFMTDAAPVAVAHTPPKQFILVQSPGTAQLEPSGLAANAPVVGAAQTEFVQVPLAQEEAPEHVIPCPNLMSWLLHIPIPFTPAHDAPLVVQSALVVQGAPN